MDFVIVGIAIGAVLVGAGALLRDIGPRFRPRIHRSHETELDSTVLATAWLRFCQTLGMVVTGLGFLLVLATVAGFVGNASDEIGWVLVGAATLLVLAGIIVSAIQISRHYQRGGFEPRASAHGQADSSADPYLVEAASFIVADRIVPLEQGGPFEFAEPEPVSQTVTGSPGQLADPSPFIESSALEEPPESLPFDQLTGGPDALEPTVPDGAVVQTDEIDPSVMENVEIAAARVATESPGDEPMLPVAPPAGAAFDVPVEINLARPAVEVDPWSPPVQQDDQTLVYEQPSHVPLLSSFDPPLIDPDDDLPSWNAPPVEQAPPPVPHSPTSEVGAAFESSLLADVGSDIASTDDLAGPFQSRLLNELTGSSHGAEPVGKDVLIAETPAPDSSRGPRSE